MHNRIREFRAARDLTRTELAQMIGANYQSIGAWERGDYDPSLSYAFRIAEALSTGIEDVFQLRVDRSTIRQELSHPRP